MRRLSIFAFTAMIVSGCAAPKPDNDQVAMQDYEQHLGPLGVEVDLVKHSKQVEWGSGFSVGDDYVLTAAHVVDSAGKETEIVVRYYDERVPAHVAAIGNRSNQDVAVLKLDRPIVALPMVPRVPLCQSAMEPGHPLAVVGAGGEFRSYGLPTSNRTGASVLKMDALSTYFAPGASGSAVVSLERECIAGVVSQQNKDDKSMGHPPGGIVHATDYKTYISDLAAVTAIFGTIHPSQAAQSK